MEIKILQKLPFGEYFFSFLHSKPLKQDLHLVYNLDEKFI